MTYALGIAHKTNMEKHDLPSSLGISTGRLIYETLSQLSMFGASSKSSKSLLTVHKYKRTGTLPNKIEDVNKK